jgi:hypothetical protein
MWHYHIIPLYSPNNVGTKMAAKKKKGKYKFREEEPSI